MSDPRKSAAPFRFTGRHMLLTLVAFFGVIFAVNMMMARYAVGSFGGTVVENSYVASQKYNDWLAEARDQKKRGWNIAMERAENGRVWIKALGQGGEALAAVERIDATAEHPLGHMPPQQLRFERQADGLWISRDPLKPGRWIVHARVVAGGIAHEEVGEVR
ncbi:MAG: FixH family protein [Blastomonas sp.]